MPVANIYSKYKILTEPYLAHGRTYVKIDKNGTETEVRFYTDNEYAEMNSVPDDATSPKAVLGFTNGYINIVSGNDLSTYQQWLKRNGARYHDLFGWYFDGSADLQALSLPDQLKLTKVSWTDIATNDILKTPKQIDVVINSLLYPPSQSKFVGTIGERIIVVLTIKRTMTMDTKFGATTLHLMEDKDGNVFKWTTGSKTLIEGNTYKLCGTIKDHAVYKNICQTVLTRCSIVE